jgi:hypothetical protein
MLALILIRQAAAHGAEVVGHVFRLRRTGNHGGDAFVRKQELEKELPQLAAKSPTQSGSELLRTAMNNPAASHGVSQNSAS